MKKKWYSCLLAGCLMLSAALGLSGCGGSGTQQSGDDKVVIYTNADPEAQDAFKHALDNHGFEGKYIMQTFGTSELGGKLIAEGKNLEADMITMSTFYIDSVQQQHHMFADITFKDPKPLQETPFYYRPTTGQFGSIFVNTEVMKKENLPMPTSIKDLTKPIYKDKISIPDIMGSSTSWLLAQAVFDAYGEKEGAQIMKQLEANAGPHLEKSGSGPLKKVKAGEVAVGFGLRHQGLMEQQKGLPIKVIDPKEGNFFLTEGVAVLNKGNAKKQEMAMKMAECLIKNARKELLKYYPMALYEGEGVDPSFKPAYPKQFKEKLTVELLKKHQDLIKK
ncbi:MAG: extracellular solute-binding protein [Acidaminococcus sp.]|jgi:ABC-type Fe3+ transport system substrate-binding protein|nr:extracellular solute-binding protein [Acidaminococcus sp.]MCI2100208.1 extracellular solute-binding protein [Acidaminococcus sp.]MCI2114527.1 extracellular solute-binding protein [Acidaminococcus sp.]MCI2116469.1 extracellular solute-binding protein [Acidaminococcus sp.]